MTRWQIELAQEGNVPVWGVFDTKTKGRPMVHAARSREEAERVIETLGSYENVIKP